MISILAPYNLLSNKTCNVSIDFLLVLTIFINETLLRPYIRAQVKSYVCVNKWLLRRGSDLKRLRIHTHTHLLSLRVPLPLPPPAIGPAHIHFRSTTFIYFAILFWNRFRRLGSCWCMSRHMYYYHIRSLALTWIRSIGRQLNLLQGGKSELNSLVLIMIDYTKKNSILPKFYLILCLFSLILSYFCVAIIDIFGRELMMFYLFSSKHIFLNPYLQIIRFTNVINIKI